MAKITVKKESKVGKKKEDIDLKTEGGKSGEKLEKEKEEVVEGKPEEKRGEKVEMAPKGEEKEAKKVKVVVEKKGVREGGGKVEEVAEEKGKVETVLLEKEKEAIPGEAAPLEEIISQVEKMTVLELSNLVKALEERFGVVAVAPALAGTAPAAIPGEEAIEKTEWSVILVAVGEKKIQVIKEVRAVTSLGLKEAKALVEEAPKPVKEGIPQKEAEEIKAKLEAVGATAELK